ncbi:hypothetical protein L1049_008910 [Liquidambar formosana]|uniref:Amino acid transporter transmembrane domain-containing protein n=1 Tax=Liquidambar formosana TaxID=63359 RepID=A0AAP0SBF9_LIQFO
MSGMKLEDDLGLDRCIEFETDDEEDLAERDCENEDDSESDFSAPSRNPSINQMDCNIPSWPQSYRKSMDMYSSVTPPSISFQMGTSLTGLSSSFLSSAYKRSQTSEYDSSLISKPLISAPSLDKEEVPVSTVPAKLIVSSYSKSSVNELTPLQQCSSAQATLNAINVLCGIGLLSTPYAVKEGGWWSLLLLIVFSVFCCYTGNLLKQCLESSPGLKTYPDIGKAAFGAAGRLGIAIILYLELYASCVEYIIMMSDNLSSLFPNTNMNFAGIYLNSHQIFAIVMTLATLPTVWLQDLSLLSYLSAGGVVTSVLVMLCLVWVGVVDQVGFHSGGKALDLANLPVSIGLYSFCYAGHSVFPNIYSSMKKPSQFPIVLIASFVICCFLYAGVAICGFLMFGDSSKSQFTLNMPKEFMASKIAVWTSVLNPISKYALTITPVALSLEELLPSAQLRSLSASILIRTVLVVSTLVVALTFPFFGFLMALIGSLLAMLIALILPPVCYLRLLNGRLTKLQIAVSIITIVVGVMSSCIGTYSAITRIADKMD